MLARYITRLRQTPKSVRDRHAFFIASGVTAFVAVVWTVTLSSTFGTPAVVEENDAPRPIASFVSRARQQAAALMAGMRVQTEAATTTISKDTPLVVGTTTPQNITLTPEDLAAARAAAAIEYVPPATTTPRVIRIATTSIAVDATSTATTAPTH